MIRQYHNGDRVMSLSVIQRALSDRETPPMQQNYFVGGWAAHNWSKGEESKKISETETRWVEEILTHYRLEARYCTRGLLLISHVIYLLMM